MFPAVVVLSGPEKTRAKAELALEKARLTIIPSKEWPIQRESYSAEHWPQLSAHPLVRLPDQDEYVPAPFVDTDEEWGFVAVLAETEALFHASYAVVEKHGWVLRQHFELPEKPKPSPQVEMFDMLMQRLDSQEQRIAELTRKLGGLPSVGGAGFESGAGEFMQLGTYSAAQLRRSVFGFAARTSANTPGLVSGGLYSSTDMQLSAAGSGLVVNTSVGECLVPGTEATSQGGYHGFLSSTNSTTLATANGSNPRIDLICATSGDAQYTLPSGGTSGALTIQAQTGTPTTGATLTNLSGAPSLPASSLLLGYVLVPATATSLTGADISNVASSLSLQNTFSTAPWTSYTPSWTGSVSAPSVGNGSLVGGYTLCGKTCIFRIYFGSGSTTNGGQGTLSFGLPFTAASGIEQDVMCKLFAANNSTTWSGAAYIGSGASTVVPQFPSSSSVSTLGSFQNAASGGASGTGIPLITGSFPLVNGSIVAVTGTYQTA